MKILFFTALLLCASQGYAAQKCIVDGRTLYKSGPCPQGTAKPISGGTFSSLSLVMVNGTSNPPPIKR